MRAYKFMTISILASSVSLMPVCAVAEDWPNWRGPQHDGISREVNWGGNWATCDPTVLWTSQVGTGFSSIAVADGQLYTMGNSELVVGRVKAAHDVVYCLDAETGQTLWTHSYPAALDPQSYEGGPSTTPTFAGDRVYTLSKQGMAYCLDARDGDVLWQSDLAATYGVRAPTWGFAGSPYIHENLVIYNAGTHGLALHAADGTPAWETGTNRSGYSTAVPFEFEGQDLLVLMGERTFAAVRAQTGDVVWEHPWVTRYNANIPDPIVESNLVFVSTGYQEGSALFDVSAGQPTQLWFQKNVQNFLNTSVLWEGYLYGPNDNGDALACVQRSTGNIIWTWNQARGRFGRGSVTLADGKLIALSEGGDLCIAEASPAGYRELGKGRILTGRCWSVPVLANGKIYARNAAGSLVCVQLETTAPRVDAGSSIITWLKAGTTTVDLSGTVEDDTADVTTISWSVIASPPGSAVDIANSAAAATAAIFTQTGWYVLELHAIDATAQGGSDRMQVSVYADGCEAARNNPVGAYVALTYDFDSDCIENFSDFAMFAAKRLEIGNFNDLAVFAAEWLEDESLTADVLYNAGKITLPVAQSTNLLESNRDN